MAELKITNEDAYDWLKGKNLAHWSSCFPSHASGERCQVKCGLGTQHVVDLVEHSCSYNYYAKETQLAICSIFIRPIRCPKYWEPLPNMLSILSPPIRRGEVGQNPLVTRHIVGVRNQHMLSTHQEVTLREKLPFKRKPAGQPITVRWMPSTQESSVSNPLMTPYGSSFSQY
ncbi:hypothetical protein GOBAR_DD00157 [Gossypium barbadense]|nr:hypothetical protein GOBAR_DD00157 [Gossypium barbadense]